MKVARKLPVPPSRRTQAAKRLQRLKDLSVGRHEENVRASLAEVASASGVETIRLRPRFVRLPRPLPEGVSDGDFKTLEPRPPAAQLVSPRGVPLRMYLIAIFVAQSMTKAGHRPSNAFPIQPPPGAGSLGWTDLIAAPARSNPGNHVRVTGKSGNRLRQIKHALDVLSSEDVRLVELPHAEATSGRYEGFRLLDESGSPGHADPVPYSVPKNSESTFAVPMDFFLQGWVHVLEDREILAYLVLCQRGAHSAGVSLFADERLRWYVLHRTTPSILASLTRFGLVETLVDPLRDVNGTYAGFSEGASPMPNEYRLTDGVHRPAWDAVVAALKKA